MTNSAEIKQRQIRSRNENEPIENLDYTI